MQVSIDKPILFCFSGPTASGKSSICQELVKRDSTLSLSISSTTRTPRPGEKEGVHYYFLSTDEFKSRVAKGFFIEHAEFGGNLYGTETRNIDRVFKENKSLILDIEVQGVEQLKAKYQTQVVTTFVFPPSMQILEARLRSRATENEAKISQRLNTAIREIEKLSNSAFSDYMLINDKLEASVLAAHSIVHAEKIRLSRLNKTAVSKIIAQASSN